MTPKISRRFPSALLLALALVSGAAARADSGATDYYRLTPAIAPCRVYDSRQATPLQSGTTRDVQVSGVCGVPATAKAVAVNVTVIDPASRGNVVVFQEGTATPSTSTLNFPPHQNKANNAFVALSAAGKITVLPRMTTAGDLVDVILDVSGYFDIEGPVLTAGGGSPTFTEDGGPVVVDPGITVTDVASANLSSATVTITNLLDSGAETLAASTAGTSITASYAAPVLTLTGADTLAHYEQVLRTVTYDNSSQNPTTTARTLDFVGNDGTTSSAPATTTVNLTAVNDAPVLTAGGGSPTFTEGGAAVAVDPGITVADVDNTNLASATVTITNLLDAGFETLAATTAGTSITASYAAPVLTLTGSDTLAHYQQVLRSVTYDNTSLNPTTTTRLISFVANDGTANSNTATTSVTLAATNNAPVLTAGGGSPAFTEGGGPVAVDPGIGVTDPDSTNLASATVTITNLLDAGSEFLAATTAGTSIVASYAAPVLTLTGADTVAHYQQVLRSVTYNNTSQNPTTTPRLISFVANDGTANSNTVTKSVSMTAVNDAPVLTAGGGSPAFTEDGPAVAVDPGITVADVDNTNLSSATVTITNLLDAGSEVLAATTAGTSIVASYAAPVLTLTGSDTLAHYQQVLRSVTYDNTSQNPSTTARVISFVASDGSANSNTTTKSVSVTAVNDAPVLTAGGGSPAFTEGGGAVAVDPGIAVSDVDNTNLASAMVTITNLLDAGSEVLAATTAGTSIVASYAAPVLTLTGSDTLAHYQQVLRSVAYNNTSQNPTTTSRLISFVASDGTANSNTVTKSVSMTAVNQAPVLTAGGGSPAFTEGGGPVAVDPGIAVADVDNANLASAQVTITNLLDAGSEFLAATTAGTSIVASYAAPVLTLTGSDTLAHYQQVLRSVTYNNTSQNPTTTSRLISFVASDGTASSNTVTKSVSMTAVNNAPVLTAGGGSPTFVEDGPAVAVDPGILVTDADSPNLASATVTITNLQNAGSEFLSATTAGTSIVASYVAPTLTLTGSDTLAHYQQVLRSITYANLSQNPSTTPRLISFVANDGALNSNTVTTGVSVVSVNDPPVLTAGGGSPTFTEGGPAVTVDPGITVVDVDNVTLASATVTITNLQDTGFETLTANTTGTSITASYAAPTLTLSGTDTLANYQQVLRSVKYNNTAVNPDITDRSISFQVNDGAANSNTVITTVKVVRAPHAPVLTTGGGTTTFTEDGGPVAVEPAMTVVDVDSTNLASATVTITNLLDAGTEFLAATTAGTTITASYVAPTLTLTGSDTVAHYQQVLRSVTYNNTSQNPTTTTRVIAFVANDGALNSNTLNRPVTVVAVNDAPVLANPGSVTFTEDGGPVTVASLTTVSDVDNTNLLAGTVTIANPQDAGFEFLAANTAGTSITASYSAPVLTLSGSDTLAHYQQVLRTVTYNNTSQNPNATPRGIAFVVNDGAANSNTLTSTVTVVPVNDAPVITNPTVTYTTPGNTQLHVGNPPPSLPGVAFWTDLQSVVTKAGPFNDPDGPLAPAVVAASGSSANGGTYSIATDGKFTYVPPAGFTGSGPSADSFTYQVSDGQASTTGTVKIDVGQRVWYVRDIVDSNNPAGGDGRSTNAFDTIAALNAATTNNGDIIFIFEGNTGTTPLSGSITLKDGQKLWGQGIALNVPGFGTSLVNATGQPHLRTTTASTDVVTVPATAGNRNTVEIRGLDLEATGATSNAVTVNATGANTVGVTISNDNIRGATGKGINLSAGTTGAYTATVQNDTITSTGIGVSATTNAAGTVTVTVSANTVSSAANAIDARTAAGAGALVLDVDNNSVTAGASGIAIDGSAAGTTTITNFANNAVSGNTVGSGILVTAAKFDNVPGGSFDTVSGGTTVIGASGNGVGASGMVFTNVSGDLSFTDLDIFAAGGVGLRASGTTPYTGSAGFQIAVGAGVSTVTAVGGPAVDLTTVKMNSLPFQQITSTNSPTTGVALNSVLGTFSAASGSSITGSTGTGFQVGSSNATISYAGTINTTAGKGIDLTSNTGSTISFTGALTLSSGSNAAFNATGGGTVTTTDTNSTLTSTTGTALNVANTTIGASGLKFKSISANGAGSGIVLNSTGASGSLSVLGTGAAGSGGTIQNTTSHGISLSSTLSPSFDRMNIQNTVGSGIKGTTVTNFTFTNGSIDNSGTGGGTDESNIAFNTSAAGTESNVSGTVTITGNSLTNSRYHGIDILNFNGTVSTVTLSNNTITSGTTAASSLGSGIRLQASGSGTTVANITKATLSTNAISNFPSGSGILINCGNPNSAGTGGVCGSGGANTVSVTSNTIKGQSSANEMGSNAIAVSVTGGNGGSRSQANFDLSTNGTVANPLTNFKGSGVACTVLGMSTATCNVANNVMVANNIVASRCISVGVDRTLAATDTPDLTATITGNSVSACDGNDIFTGALNSNGIARIKVQNNTLAAPLTGNRAGIQVNSGTPTAPGTNTTVCLNITGNTSAGSGVSQGIGLRKEGTVATTNAFGINGMAATASPGVESYVDGLNPAGGGTLLTSATSGFTNCSLP